MWKSLLAHAHTRPLQRVTLKVNYLINYQEIDYRIALFLRPLGIRAS